MLSMMASNSGCSPNIMFFIQSAFPRCNEEYFLMEERGEVGLGVFVMRKLKDSVEYTYEGGMNNLTHKLKVV